MLGVVEEVAAVELVAVPVVDVPAEVSVAVTDVSLEPEGMLQPTTAVARTSSALATMAMSDFTALHTP
jgi:hypothetical protein